MAVYAPSFFPADRLSFTTGAAVLGGQVVYLSAANAVSPTAAAVSSWIGVAAADQAIVGGAVTVLCEGVHGLTATGTIAAGDIVISAAAGTVATVGADTVAGHVVGKALTAATNGQTVQVRLVA